MTWLAAFATLAITAWLAYSAGWARGWDAAHNDGSQDA